jgi:hypothetical protein
MPTPEKGRFPDWAERERASDLAWIKENWHVFWPVAQQAYEEWGRGALVVDTTIVVLHDAGAGSPISYVSQDRVQEKRWEDLTRMVREYDPFRELVAVLLKEHNRQSAYRVSMASG